MSQSLDDPIFVGRLTSVAAPFDYHVEFHQRSSDAYHVEVFEYPELIQAFIHCGLMRWMIKVT